MEKIHFDGYKKFRKEYFKDNKKLFNELSEGQKPHTMIITCSDSRVAPTKILSATPGELFISRNIGNIVPPYERTQGATQSAIEYAVNSLKVEHLVILGHSSCGACSHLYHEITEDNKDVELGHVDEWLKLAYPAKHNAILECLNNPQKSRAEVTEKNNIQLSIQRLMTYPYIVKALEDKRLELHGWWYDIGSGKLEAYDYGSKTFREIEI
ncbi:MAG: carbonic anhydrase [Sulfurovaceae bacterium]|nr:carbonic anhydrase [Sulfurovaceae bacterium]